MCSWDLALCFLFFKPVKICKICVSEKRTVFMGKGQCFGGLEAVFLADWWLVKVTRRNLKTFHSLLSGTESDFKEKMCGPHLHRFYDMWQDASAWKNLIPASCVTMTPEDTVWVGSPQRQRSLRERLGGIWLRCCLENNEIKAEKISLPWLNWTEGKCVFCVV